PLHGCRPGRAGLRPDRFAFIARPFRVGPVAENAAGGAWRRQGAGRGPVPCNKTVCRRSFCRHSRRRWSRGFRQHRETGMKRNVAARLLATAALAGLVAQGALAQDLSALEAAARAEGMLTTVALPHNWCGYGEVIAG